MQNLKENHSNCYKVIFCPFLPGMTSFGLQTVGHMSWHLSPREVHYPPFLRSFVILAFLGVQISRGSEWAPLRQLNNFFHAYIREGIGLSRPGFKVTHYRLMHVIYHVPIFFKTPNLVYCPSTSEIPCSWALHYEALWPFPPATRKRDCGARQLHLSVRRTVCIPSMQQLTATMGQKKKRHSIACNTAVRGGNI